MDIDSLRRDVEFETELRGVRLQLQSTWGLFSPRGIDEGSRLLLDHVDVEDGDDCLDLGCGYGPMGLVIARLARSGRTLLVDKDFVAVEYAARNAVANGIGNAEARLSNGFSHVGDDEWFDLIVANLPAKTGKELLWILLHDARAHLRPGGRLFVVTLSNLRHFVRRALEAEFGDYRKVKQGRTYTVACAIHAREPTPAE